jgi:hypothetical protein
MPDFSTKLRGHPPRILAKDIFIGQIAKKTMLAAGPGGLIRRLIFNKTAGRSFSLNLMTTNLNQQLPFSTQLSDFLTLLDLRTIYPTLQNKKIHVKQYELNLGPIPAI